MRRTDSLEKTLMLGKIEGRRRRGQKRMRYLGGINLSKLWELVMDREPGMLQFMGLQSWTLTNWTEQSISCKVPGYMSYKLESRLLGEIPRTWNAQMWNETISCHINLEEMPQPSPISHLQIWMRAPQTMIQRVLPPTVVIAQELEECKKRGEQGNTTGQRLLKYLWKEWVQWAQRLAISHT